jgi:hypothetical protein
MPILLGSLRCDIYKSTYDSDTGTTSKQTLYKQNVQCYGQPMYARHYYGLNASAMKATYEIVVDRHIDVQMGDVVRNITLRDKKTPWPDDIPLDTYEWHVVHIKPTAANPLAGKICFLTRVMFKGALHGR